MYSRKAWGGDVEPFILTKFVRDGDAGDSDPLVSLVVFEWSDEALIGRAVSDDADVYFFDHVWRYLPANKHHRRRKLSATKRVSMTSSANQAISAPSSLRRTQASPNSRL